MTKRTKKKNAEDKDLRALYQKGKGRYMLINVLCRRVKRLLDGEKPAVTDTTGLSDCCNIATEELKEGKLKVRPRKHRGKLVDLAKDRE